METHPIVSRTGIASAGAALRRSLALLLVVLAAAGCQLTPTFTVGYTPEPARLRESPLPASLAVRTFDDRRPPRYYASPHRIWLTYIPFLPYVTMPYERIDGSVQEISSSIERGGRGFTRGAEQKVAPAFEGYTYPNSFAAAVAADLAASGIFQDVRYVGDGAVEGHRFVLDGVLHETPLRTSTTSFGLGMAGVLLWLLPIPMSRTSAEARLDLTLTDQQTGEPVWQRTIEGRVSRLITLYTSSALVYGRSGAWSFQVVPPPADAGVDRRSLFGWNFGALRQGMLEARSDLARSVAGRMRAGGG
jgi:hypothetical protein